MNKSKIIFSIIACSLLAIAARAQITNVPLTELEAFEAQTQTVLIKGVSEVGEISADGSLITVRCKQTIDVNTGRKLGGVAVDITERQQPRETTLIDFDEMNSLLNGINYLSKIDYEVTPMPTFQAVYSTKAGLRVVAFSSRRTGAIQLFLQSANTTRISISASQLSQFRSLIEQAKNSLDSLRAVK